MLVVSLSRPGLLRQTSGRRAQKGARAPPKKTKEEGERKELLFSVGAAGRVERSESTTKKKKKKSERCRRRRR